MLPIPSCRNLGNSFTPQAGLQNQAVVKQCPEFVRMLSVRLVCKAAWKNWALGMNEDAVMFINSG